MNCIRYGAGYKYQLRELYRVQVEILPERPIVTPWICLAVDGWLSVSPGYAWDGPSGPTFDTADAMRGSLVHDALYQLMREGHLDARHRAYADRALYRMCLEDGMWKPRAWLWYIAVRAFADPAADPASAAPDKRAGNGCSDPPLPN